MQVQHNENKPNGLYREKTLKNFRTRTILPSHIIDSIVADVDLHPELWNQHNFRTTHKSGVFKDCSDIVLQYNDLSAPDIDWIEAVPFPAMYLLPGARVAAH